METATGSGRHCSVTASSGGRLAGIATPQRRQQSPFLPLLQTGNGSPVNRVERWKLSGGQSLTSHHHRQYPVAQYHDGGRFALVQMACCTSVQVMLESRTSQNVNSVWQDLRLTPDGQVPRTIPFQANPLYPRNSQHPGFDWINSSTLWVTDHGPSGDLGLYGHDEVNVATAGNNLAGLAFMAVNVAKAPSVPILPGGKQFLLVVQRFTRETRFQSGKVV